MSESLDSSDLNTLKATYEEVRRERDRLRDARGWASRQLGPLPAAAGISTGIVSAFSGQLHRGWLYGALAGLIVMVLIGIAYSRMQPYRQTRAAKENDWRKKLEERHPRLAEEANQRGLVVEDLLPETEWYSTMIRFERRLYGPLDRTDNRYGLPRRQPKDLQDASPRAHWLVCRADPLRGRDRVPRPLTAGVGAFAQALVA